MPPVGTCVWCGVKLRTGACVNKQCVLYPLTQAQKDMSKQPPQGTSHEEWRRRYFAAQGKP